MGKKTQDTRRQVRAEIRSIVARQRAPQPAFPEPPRVTSVDIAALDYEIEKRGQKRAQAESDSIIARLSARFAPKRA